MIEAEAPTSDRRPPAGPATTHRKRHMPPFWRHFFQMLAVMVAGMIATGAIFLTLVGVKTWNEVTIQYPAQALMAMAAGMTLDQLAEMGYSGVLYPVTLLRVSMKAAEAALALLGSEGTQRELLDVMQTREELYDLLGYSDFEDRDRGYFS